MKKKENNLNHVAIIMDGNGRWGEQKCGKRTEGHTQGAKTVRNIVRAAGKLNLQHLTLWGFSTDNWKRPENEVNVLMQLFKKYIVRKADELDKMKVRVTFIGQRERLQEQLQVVMKQIEDRTKSNEGLHLQIALNYGGKDEMVDAVKSIIKSGLAPDDVSGEIISKFLYTDEVPDPDLVIRTGKESRTSGFMPWQTAHSEWIFSDTLWPDFTEGEFLGCIEEYKSRSRRKGDVSAA